MNFPSDRSRAGFTLVELLTALLILSLLAVISYRGLDAVLDARDRVSAEADKWQRLAAFFARFERDIALAAPRSVRNGAAWLGRPCCATPGADPGPRLELSRFAETEGVDQPRRIAYGLNAQHQVELWLWPGLDVAPATLPTRYPLLHGVRSLELHYLGPDLSWVEAWPMAPDAAALPRAVRLRVVLISGEAVVRVFGLNP